jgi:hypothetical protein
MPRILPVLLALGLLTAPVSAEVVVRVTSNLVDIDAEAVPLADILEDLAGQTGMEVVYEGAPPRQRVSLTLRGRSPAEAVQDVLEGQGLNYALIADPTGTRVQTLMIAGAAGTGTSAGPATPMPGPRPRRPILPPPAASPEGYDAEYDEMYEEDPFEDPALLEEEYAEEPLEEPAVGPPGAGVPAPQAPVPAAGPMPFPGGQQMFPASPFAPQPTFPGAAPEAPEAGEAEAQPAPAPP